MRVNTRRYLLKVRVRTPKGQERAHEMVCCGLNDITKVHKVIAGYQVELEEWRCMSQKPILPSP